MLSGCDSVVDISPNIQDVSYQAPSYEVVTGTLNEVDTDFNIVFYACNADDLLLYQLSDGAAVLNTDSTQVICNPKIFLRFMLSETTRPLIKE